MNEKSTMALFTYTFAGLGFLLIGALESLLSISHARSSPSPQLDQISSKASPPPSANSTAKNRVSSSVTLIAVAVLSFLFISNGLVSLIDASDSRDLVGSAAQLEVISIALLFLLYAVLGLVFNLTGSPLVPPSVVSLICLFAFVEEFLLFYLQRKDPSGIENRYFSLLLVPITICVCSTVLELKNPNSSIPRLARGVGLISQGAWFLQMGVSFFTDLIAHGCSLHQKSRGNYTVRCKGHPEYHRGRAIATLQFNCHLALLLVLIVGLYSIMCRRNSHCEFMRYRPLGAEMQQMDQQSRFTLVSDDDDDDDDDELKEEVIVKMQKDAGVVSGLGMNGHGSHQ